jgi:DedD protein
MKLVVDEKLKHRLIGLAVIISLAAIFAPAVMKKSSQHLDHKLSVHVKLPQKPVAPDVVLTDEKEMFKTIKVARVNIQPVTEERQLTELVKAEPVHLALNEAANHRAKKIIKTAATQSVKQSIPIKQPVKVALKQKAVPAQVVQKQITGVIKKPVIKRDIYAVQLASFSQLINAQALVDKLRLKGYKANVVKTSANEGEDVYKVYAGHSPDKLEVIRLKAQLASTMQLRGFVVNTGVS